MFFEKLLGKFGTGGTFDRKVGNQDPDDWLDRHVDKRGGPDRDAPGFENGHCFHGHGEDGRGGHGDHDHWNNGQWRHQCNEAPVIQAGDGVEVVGDVGLGGVAMFVFASDPDGDQLQYSLAPSSTVGSEDADMFEIDSFGIVTTLAPIERDGSVDGDGRYEIQVIVSDGQAETVQDFDIIYSLGA